MSEGQSVADLMLRMGVDVGEMISGFNSAGRISRQMAKDMAEGMNASLQKAFDPSAINSGRMFENLETQYRATVSTMLRESIQARAVIERSVANINQAASESMIAGMTKVGGTKFDPMISMLNAAATKQKQQAAEQAEQAVEDELLRRQDLINSYNTEQRELRETADAVRRNQEDYNGLVQQMRDAEAAGRRLSTARRLDAKDAEQAARTDQQQARAREALAASLADGEERQNRRREVAARLQAKLDADSQRIKEAGAKQAVEAAETEARINRQVAAEATAVSQADRRAQEMLTEQMERGNEVLQFRNRLRREARAFASQLEEAGITPGSARYNQMTQAFRQEQQRQRDEFANRDRRAAATRRQNELDQQAARIIRSVMSAEAAHAQRLRELEELYQTNRLSLDQYNEAMRQSEQVMNSQRAGFGQTSGVLAQLSFGVEDFAQGIAMGDLRAAMLGASNNITMVVRGLISMDAAARAAIMSTTALAAAFVLIPTALFLIVDPFEWLKSAVKDARSLADAIRDATMGLDKFNKTAEFQSRMRDVETSVSRVTSVEDAIRREQELANEKLNAERKLQNVQREAAIEAQATIDMMLGGSSARAELEKYIAKTRSEGAEDEIQAVREIERLVAQSQEAARQGEAESVINNMRRVFELLNERNLDLGDDWIADITALDALEEFFQKNYFTAGEDADKLRELREQLLKTDEKITEAEREQQLIAAELISLEIKRQELAAQKTHEMERQARLAATLENERQKEELFLIKATEQERELYRLRQEQKKFVGEQNMQLLGMNPLANFGAMMQLGVQQVEAQADQMAFLEAQKQAAQNEMNALMQQEIPKAQGALEQNAFQAQADAFKQMTENMAQKPNPQLTQVVNRLKAIEDAIKAGGAFIQVGP